MNKKSNGKKLKTILNPPSAKVQLTDDERLDLFADILIERTIEEEKLYKQRLKTDPNAKRFYEK